MALGIARVHAEEVSREQGSLVAAGAGAHLEDGALLVGGILGQEVDAQLLLHLLHALLDLVELLLRHLLEAPVGGGIVDDLDQIVALGLELAQLLHGLHDRVEIGEFLGELRVGGGIDAAVEVGLDLLPALHDLVELVGRDGGHGR